MAVERATSVCVGGAGILVQECSGWLDSQCVLCGEALQVPPGRVALYLAESGEPVCIDCAEVRVGRAELLVALESVS